MQPPDPGPRGVSSPALREYARVAAAQVSELHGIAAELSDAQWQWRPAPRRWSVGQHVAHLALTTRQYLTPIERAADAGRAKGMTGPGRSRGGWIGEWFVRSLEPPPKPRIPTVRRLVPASDDSRAEVLAAFDAVHGAFVESLYRVDGLDLGKVRMRSPFLKLLKLSLDQAFRAVLAHNRRHFWLIREVMRAPGFLPE